MSRWELRDTANIPNNGGEMRLFVRDSDFAIRVSGQGELMNSRTHGSEDALGTMPCEPLRKNRNAHVLIGGLGMGFTLAAALTSLATEATVTVVELVDAVLQWNRGDLGECAGHPLRDPRVVVHEGDVAVLIRKATDTYNAILLDVDNGPEGLTHEANDQLYSLAGLGDAYNALRANGTLAVWSAGPDVAFGARLRKTGFAVDERHVRAHRGKGARHTIWLATRD